MSNNEYDYIVVGSGAGGGPLAANLAKAGYTVCLIDAGRRPAPDNAHYNVPVFHPMATEDPELAWYTYVRHYEDQARQEADDKYQNSTTTTPNPPPSPPNSSIAPRDPNPPIPGGTPDHWSPPLHVPQPAEPPWRYPLNQPKDGIFYPRASALGGCTTHHASICVYPHNADWEDIVRRTGDASWNPDAMRGHFQDLERCNYRPVLKWIHRIFRWNPSRHGFSGWLPTKTASPTLVVKDKELVKLLVKSVFRTSKDLKPSFWKRIVNAFRTIRYLGDANDWRLVKQNAEGVRQTALSVNQRNRRSAVREFVESVEKKRKKFLTIKTKLLVEKVLFDEQPDADGKWRARGVRCYPGEDLYEATANYDPAVQLGEAIEITARREVILSGGAYATPQMLMLSGIGDHEYLRSVGMAESDLRVDLPGVGKNMQDRYEVGMIQEMKTDFSLLSGAKFEANQSDPLYVQWQTGKNSVYGTNGAVLSIIKKSTPARPLPDLYVFGVAGPFRGYEPGYSHGVKTTKREFTWAILKAHTKNNAGEVLLNRDDPLNPRRLPYINFKYFSEGSDTQGEDLESMVAGVKFVRSLTSSASKVIEREAYPGTDRVPTDDDAKIRQWVEANAWGHHASCTCPIGREADIRGGSDGIKAVLNSKFEVFGTKGLRVVDACVFPRIPGFFIVVPIFMISQKASAQIIADARASSA